MWLLPPAPVSPLLRMPLHQQDASTTRPCPRNNLITLDPATPPATYAAYMDLLGGISYPAGLYLSTKMALPQLGLSGAQVEVAIAAADGTFAKTLAFKFPGSTSPMPFVNLTDVQAVWEAGKSMVSVGCNVALAAAWP